MVGRSVLSSAPAQGHRKGRAHLSAAHRPVVREQDLNCLFPLGRLLELERNGEIGRSAERHYSFMGYILQPSFLLGASTPEMIRRLKVDAVDAVLLVPF